MPRKLTRSEEYARTRRNIITVARQLFLTKGYHAVSTREIAKACAITQPALYHHFPDKECLYVAVLIQETASVRHAFALIYQQHDLPPEERLKKMLLVLIHEHPINIPYLLEDIFSALSPENQQMIYTLWKDTYLEPFKQVLMEWNEQGLLRTSLDLEFASRFCLSSILPFTMGYAKKADYASIDKRLSTIIDFILNGLLKSK